MEALAEAAACGGEQSKFSTKNFELGVRARQRDNVARLEEAKKEGCGCKNECLNRVPVADMLKTELKRCVICTKLATLLEQALREADGSQRWLDIEKARRWVLHEHKALKDGEWLAFKKLETLATDATSPFLFLAIDGSPGLSIPSLSSQVAGLH